MSVTGSKKIYLFVLLNCLGCVLLVAGIRYPGDFLAIPTIKICKLQGSGYSTPFYGQTIRTQGIVYADFDEKGWGFYFQEPDCDSDPKTSDGVFVYLGEHSQTVNSGDLVKVVGIAQEYYGMTELLSTPAHVTILSSGNPLPEPIELYPPFDNQQAKEYLESLEGMRVSIGEARVVGPTNSSNESWVIRSDLEMSRVFYDDPRGTGEVICVDGKGLYKITPQVQVGNQVQGLVGALAFSLGDYRMQLTEPPLVLTTTEKLTIQSKLDTVGNQFSIATLNLYNLFDTFDDPEKDDSVLSNTEYQRRLRKRALVISEILNEPDLIAMQEAENLAVLQALVARPEILSEYGIAWADTPDKRGLDTAILFRRDRVELINTEQHQGCTKLVDGLGPDGNGDPKEPFNESTCDSDSDGILDGNRLFSRPPLLARVIAHTPVALSNKPVGEHNIEFILVVNHWKSKSEDTSTIQYTLPRRIEQAEFVAQLTHQTRALYPDLPLVVLGDLNDVPGSDPLAILQRAGLSNLVSLVENSQRFSYIYKGVSQVIDHILMLPHPAYATVQVDFFPINADFPNMYISNSNSIHRSSDHDPLRATFRLMKYLNYLPLVNAITP